MAHGTDGDGDVERWSAPFAWLYATLAADPSSNRVVVDLAAPGVGDVVVDVGCGAGAAVRRAARTGAEAIGVEPSPAMARIAGRRCRHVHGAAVVEGHAAALPVGDDHATILWSIAAYHHWPDRRAGLEEARRVLRPGGRILLGEKRLRRAGGHGLTEEDAADAASLLRQLGFTDVGVTEHRAGWRRMLVVRGRA